MTINHYMDTYKTLRLIESLDDSQIEPFLLQHKTIEQYPVKNYIGRSFSSSGDLVGLYAGYLLRITDTDIKIMLLNEMNQQKKTGQMDLSKIQNPYFSQPKHPYWSHDGKQVCLDKPTFDNQQDKILGNRESKFCLIVRL